MPDLAPNEHPPRKTVISWLKVNLAVTMFICTMVSGGLGMLVQATLRYADNTHRMDDIGDTIARMQRDIETLKASMIDVDRRFNESSTKVADMRRQRDQEVSSDESRIAVLEAQLRFFADRQNGRVK